MKPLESITINLELSNRLDVLLKKAGIKVEPLFWWTKDDKKYVVRDYKVIGGSDRNGEYFEPKNYPALTASEIGVILGTKANYWSNLRKAYCEVMDLTEDIIVPEQIMLNVMEQPDIGVVS